MPRHRTLDPSNLPSKPNPTSDPEREAELLAEFKGRVAYITLSYRCSRKTEDRTLSLRESLMRLRNRLSGKTKSKERGDRIHSVVETLINQEARTIACERGTKVDQEAVELAARRVMAKATIPRGRPGADTLEYHVTGLMALIQSFAGHSVVAQRYGDIDDYSPHFATKIGQALLAIVQSWDPQITETQLVNLVRKIRKKFAGKPMHFEDFFPLFGVSMDSDAPEKGFSSTRIESFEPNFPIYCP